MPNPFRDPVVIPFPAPAGPEAVLPPVQVPVQVQVPVPEPHDIGGQPVSLASLRGRAVNPFRAAPALVPGAAPTITDEDRAFFERAGGDDAFGKILATGDPQAVYNMLRVQGLTPQRRLVLENLGTERVNALYPTNLTPAVGRKILAFFDKAQQEGDPDAFAQQLQALWLSEGKQAPPSQELADAARAALGRPSSQAEATGDILRQRGVLSRLAREGAVGVVRGLETLGNTLISAPQEIATTVGLGDVPLLPSAEEMFRRSEEGAMGQFARDPNIFIRSFGSATEQVPSLLAGGGAGRLVAGRALGFVGKGKELLGLAAMSATQSVPNAQRQYVQLIDSGVPQEQAKRLAFKQAAAEMLITMAFGGTGLEGQIGRLAGIYKNAGAAGLKAELGRQGVNLSAELMEELIQNRVSGAIEENELTGRPIGEALVEQFSSIQPDDLETLITTTMLVGGAGAPSLASAARAKAQAAPGQPQAAPVAPGQPQAAPVAPGQPQAAPGQPQAAPVAPGQPQAAPAAVGPFGTEDFGADRPTLPVGEGLKVSEQMTDQEVDEEVSALQEAVGKDSSIPAGSTVSRGRYGLQLEIPTTTGGPTVMLIRPGSDAELATALAEGTAEATHASAVAVGGIHKSPKFVDGELDERRSGGVYTLDEWRALTPEERGRALKANGLAGEGRMIFARAPDGSVVPVITTGRGSATAVSEELNHALVAGSMTNDQRGVVAAAVDRAMEAGLIPRQGSGAFSGADPAGLSQNNAFVESAFQLFKLLTDPAQSAKAYRTLGTVKEANVLRRIWTAIKRMFGVYTAAAKTWDTAPIRGLAGKLQQGDIARQPIPATTKTVRDVIAEKRAEARRRREEPARREAERQAEEQKRAAEEQKRQVAAEEKLKKAQETEAAKEKTTKTREAIAAQVADLDGKIGEIDATLDHIRLRKAQLKRALADALLEAETPADKAALRDGFRAVLARLDAEAASLTRSKREVRRFRNRVAGGRLAAKAALDRFLQKLRIADNARIEKVLAKQFDARMNKSVIGRARKAFVKAKAAAARGATKEAKAGQAVAEAAPGEAKAAREAVDEETPEAGETFRDEEVDEAEPEAPEAPAPKPMSRKELVRETAKEIAAVASEIYERAQEEYRLAAEPAEEFFDGVRKTAAIKKPTEAKTFSGEYDGYRDLPPGLKRMITADGGRGIPVNEAAKILFEEGLIESPSPDAIWKAAEDAYKVLRDAEAKRVSQAEARRQAEKLVAERGTDAMAAVVPEMAAEEQAPRDDGIDADVEPYAPEEGEDFGEAAPFSMSRRTKNPRVRKTIAELVASAEEQSSWRDWYTRHNRVIADLFDEDRDLFRKLLSATSQATNVKANVALALKAYDQLKSGRPFTGYLPAVIKNLDRIAQEVAVEGPKISAFDEANAGGDAAIPVDRHISVFLFNSKTPTKAQIAKGQKVIRTVAARLGWAPREVQAALWAANQVRLGTDPEKVQSYDSLLQARAEQIRELRQRFADTGREGESLRRGRAAPPRSEEGGEGGVAGTFSLGRQAPLLSDKERSVQEDFARSADPEAGRNPENLAIRTLTDVARRLQTRVDETLMEPDEEVLPAQRGDPAAAAEIVKGSQNDPGKFATRLERALKSGKMPTADQHLAVLVIMDAEAQLMQDQIAKGGDMAAVVNRSKLFKRFALIDRAIGSALGARLSHLQDRVATPEQRRNLFFSTIAAPPEAVMTKARRLMKNGQHEKAMDLMERSSEAEAKRVNDQLKSLGLDMSDPDIGDVFSMDPDDPDFGFYRIMRDVFVAKEGWKLGELLHAYFIQNLFSPATAGANITGNALMAAAMGGEAIAEGLVNDALRLFGKKVTGRSSRDVASVGKAILRGLGPALGDALRTAASGLSSTDLRMGRLQAQSTLEKRAAYAPVFFGGGLKSRVASAALTPLLRMISFIDEVFKSIVYRASLTAAALDAARGSGLEMGTAAFDAEVKRLLDAPPMKLRKDAIYAADEATFKEELDKASLTKVLERWLSHLRNATIGEGTAFAVRPGVLIVPFLSAIARITRQAGRRAIGVQELALLKDIATGFARGDFTLAKKQAFRNLTGYALALAALFLRDEDDEDLLQGLSGVAGRFGPERQMDLELGKGGTLAGIDITRLDPLALAAVHAANVRDAFLARNFEEGRTGEDRAGRLVGKTLDAMLGNRYFDGIRDILLPAVFGEYETAGRRAGQTLVKGLTPLHGTVRQIERDLLGAAAKRAPASIREALSDPYGGEVSFGALGGTRAQLDPGLTAFVLGTLGLRRKGEQDPEQAAYLDAWASLQRVAMSADKAARDRWLPRPDRSYQDPITKEQTTAEPEEFTGILEEVGDATLDAFRALGSPEELTAVKDPHTALVYMGVIGELRANALGLAKVKLAAARLSGEKPAGVVE